MDHAEEMGRYRSLLERRENALSQLLSLTEGQTLSDYEDELVFLEDLSNREALCEEIRALSAALREMGRDLAADSALRMEEERQKERLQSILSRIRIANDKAIADVQNRMSFYKGEIETLRKAKAGMDLYRKNEFPLQEGSYNWIG